MFCITWLMQRWLLMELFSLGSESSPKSLVWSEELYSGEFDNLCLCNLWSEETNELLHPSLKGHESNTPIVSSNQHPNAEVLQVLNSLLSIVSALIVDTHKTFINSPLWYHYTGFIHGTRSFLFSFNVFLDNTNKMSWNRFILSRGLQKWTYTQKGKNNSSKALSSWVNICTKNPEQARCGMNWSLLN